MNPGNWTGGYGPTSPFAVLTVNGIPDTITHGEWRRLLLRPYRITGPDRTIVRWRDTRVVFSDLGAAQRSNLLDPDVKAANIGYTAFLAATHLERAGRRLEENDILNPADD